MHKNLTSYNDFEKLDSFGDNLEGYRQSKITGANSCINFLREHTEAPITMLELGSGNSRTLYAAEIDGMLKRGYGIEISPSRVDFADVWKKDWRLHKVTNINSDVVTFDFATIGKINVCLCVDLAFQLFEPIREGAALDVLRNVGKILTGKIIIEIDGCYRILNRLCGNKVNLWEEFPYPDPWRFSLWDCEYNDKTEILQWNKTFIHRNEHRLSEYTAFLKVYRKQQIHNLLKKSGFSNIKFYADWDSNRFVDDTLEFIVTGEI